MSSMTKLLRSLLIISLILIAFSSMAMAGSTINIPVLCYHNLNPVKPGSMNMTPKKFESQLKWIIDHGYTIIPLKDAVAYLKGSRTTLPSKPIVITADDGWVSNYTYMLPIIKKYKIPVTLFIYPETISNGKNALTWAQLKDLKSTGYFEIESHTYSHPNFKQAKKRLSPAAYDAFVQKELVNSKKILEEKLGTKVTVLAWPFGIYNDQLEKAAAKAGYDMAFTIDYRTANKSFMSMGQPRYMIIDGLSENTFQNIVKSSKP